MLYPSNMNVRKHGDNAMSLGKEAIPGCVHSYYITIFYFDSCFYLPRMIAG